MNRRMNGDDVPGRDTESRLQSNFINGLLGIDLEGVMAK